MIGDEIQKGIAKIIAIIFAYIAAVLSVRLLTM